MTSPKLGAALVAGCMAAAVVSAGAEPVMLTLGTATQGGGFEIYGDALARAVREVEPDLIVRVRRTGGSRENVALLRAGTLDLALVQGTTAYEALSGRTPAAADPTIVGAMYSSPGMFVVRADQPYRTIEDLRGRRVIFGAAGSGLVTMAAQVLDGLGLDIKRDFDAVFLEHVADGPRQVLDGTAAALWGAGVGWPGFEAVARGLPGARFIGLVPEQIARVTQKHPMLEAMTLAAGSYPGQAQPVATVGSWSFIMARPGLSEEAAYRLTCAMNTAGPKMAALLPQACETTAAKTLIATARIGRLHPGTVRCLRDLGIAP